MPGPHDPAHNEHLTTDEMRLNVQATQPTTLTAPAEAREPEPQGATIAQAHALVGRIIARLATLPRDIELKREIGGEYSVHFFWSSDVSGVCALASWAEAPWGLVPSEYNAGIYAETRPVIDGVAVWAWTLLTPAEAVDAEQLLAVSQAPAPTDPDTEHAHVPVPDGEIPVAQAEQYDKSMDRYVASLGGSVVAHVPAIEAGTDDTDTGSDTMSFGPVSPDTGGVQ